MDNLRKGIKIYFSKWSPENIDYENKNISKESKLFSLNHFRVFAKGSTYFDTNSISDIDAVFRKLTEDWMCCPKKTTPSKSVFFLLSHFTDQVLTQREAEPYVIHHHLLKWRDVTMDLGEDIFTTSYLASKDLKARQERTNFSWRPTLFSDNYRLHQILQQGVAENHSHLWASSLTFDINWMALMNRYKETEEDLRKFLITSSLNEKISLEFNSKKLDFEVWIKKAITIRLVLHLLLNNISIHKQENSTKKQHNKYLSKLLEGNLDSLFQPSNKEDSIELLSNFNNILQYIELLGIEKGLKVKHANAYHFFDFTANNQMHPDNIDSCFYLYGERHLMYQAFKFIYKADYNNLLTKKIEILLHSYLLIKNQLRQELILLNKRIGFENFEHYQRRNFSFIPYDSIYSTIFLRITLNYNRRLMNIVSNEFRISPEIDLDGWIKNLNQILEQRLKKKEEKGLVNGYEKKDYLLDRISSKKKENKKEDLHFVVHFFKEIDNKFKKQNQKISNTLYTKQLITPRDFKVREKVKDSSKSLVKLREQKPVLARRITGIDAASNELACRPEAFSQAFRFLKDHQTRIKNSLFKDEAYNNQLSITFHAGEDFYDVVDGMRYIDECIRFLNMGQGDRFGHALAIGIDVRTYYQKKQNKIVLTKQTLLDNVVWLLAKIRKFGLGQHINQVSYLENKFIDLYSKIYLNNNVDPSLRTIDFRKYYEAWKLRGDEPKIYYNVISKYNKNKQEELINDLSTYFTNEISLSFWEKCRLNDYSPKLKNIRNKYEIIRLYYEYHFNPQVKNTGNEMTQFEITKPYIKLVEDVQIAMMRYVEERNLSIETNPTSNFLIGPIDRYIEHPIFKWYNLGLHHDKELLEKSPQLSVSINTDDAGIFSTSLENEFALMAIALEKEKDEYGNPLYSNSIIYDWIDRVRKMGIEQSFNRKK